MTLDEFDQQKTGRALKQGPDSSALLAAFLERPQAGKIGAMAHSVAANPCRPLGEGERMWSGFSALFARLDPGSGLYHGEKSA
ncbi:MAG: hypothetical protein KGL90_09635 [Burkholderiales bacterium]|nr:hypothetical protein [Burkholderiales bacterium]